MPRVSRSPGSAVGRLAARPRRRLLPLLVASAALSCGTRGASPPGGPAGASGSPVEVQSGKDHPSLSLVARAGDPFSAVAVAVAHDLGPMVSTWLEALVEERLSLGAPQPVEPRASATGFVVRARIDSSEQAKRFTRAIRDALGTPVTEAERSRVVTRVHAQPALRTWASAADRAVGECVGEMGTTGEAGAPTTVTLERMRRAVFATRTVALAAVGRRDVLDATARALRDTDAWPTTSAPEDPWPTADLAGVSRTETGGRTLSVALRVPDAARALAAATALGARGAPLVVHASALERRWTVDRVVGAARPRGACLRIDLETVGGSPSRDEVASVAALSLDEAARSLAEAPSSTFSLDRGVLESADPRDAAAIAAWRALGGQLEPGPTRTFVSYGGSLGGTDDATFARAVTQARADRTRLSVDVRRASELGQGEVWVLLASPCATSSETSQEAGLAALSLRTLAHETPALDGARIEPWISGDGIGLLAHGPRGDSTETPARHATRIANALGRVFAATPIEDEDVAAARLELQAQLDPETQLLWPVAIDALAPKHPSLLDPRGTWRSVTELSSHAAELERRALVRGPLRLAVLTNGAPGPAADAELAIERWLRPERTQKTPCPVSPTFAARPGEYEVEASTGTSGRALVAVQVPTRGDGGIPLEASWTVYLMNRPGGWLDRSLRAPGLAAQAEATVIGGGASSALAVELVAAGDKAREAAAQVRALFARLADGAMTAEELTLARTASEQATVAASVDPRHRIVQLWLGRTETPSPDLGALRRFHREVLTQARHVVVVTRARP